MDSALSWLAGRARRLGYRSYYRLVAVNYAHQWLSTENTTPAGTFRSYELLNRHGSDPMLAELDAVARRATAIVATGASPSSSHTPNDTHKSHSAGHPAAVAVARRAIVWSEARAGISPFSVSSA